MNKAITYVTALYNLRRDTLNQGFNRSMEQYFDAFRKLLSQDINLVIYCDQEVSDFVWKHGSVKNTKVIVEDIKFPFKDQVEKIRTQKEWYSQASWLEQSPQAKLEWYNPLVMSKQFKLNDSSIHNHFNSDYFFWIDAGLANTVNLGYFKESNFEDKLISKVRNNKMLYIAFPYDGKNEVHGFKKSAMNQYSGTDTEYVCRGGFFGGSKTAIEKVNGVYYGMLGRTLENGYMGTEESVFTIISYTNPELINLEAIEANGLLYTFFENLKKVPKPRYSGTALYFLTFNLPEQLEYSLSSFKKAFPDFFNKCNKVLLNNSTDPSVKDEYEALINEYDLDELKFDNIGICGARQKAAEHFAESDYEFMIFFEDDMIVNNIDRRGQYCGVGFPRYVEDLFTKAENILVENGLGYLKLSFSEFFGDNHKNWAWYNMNDKDRDNWLSHENHTQKNKIEYTGVYRGLSYSVGEYHYCNWPLLFSKDGNREVFLNPIDKHPFEQKWMANTQKKLRNGKLKSGVLLASPITHNRKHHYSRKERKES